MQTNINGTRFKKIYFRKKSTDEYVLYKKAYIDGVQTYSAGNPVTYVVDSGVSYTEEVEYGASCLSPKTFTPAKSGWTFVGWREDKTANASVFTTKVMGDNPITLYAVFKATVTQTFISYSGKSQTASGTRYYNNGNVVNATIKAPTGTAYSGWTWRGWSAAGVTTANAAVSYANGGSIANQTGAATYYGLYQKTITLTTVANGKSTANTGTAYFNGSGTTLNPTFTVANPTKSGATFKGWSTSASSTTVSNSTISGLSLSANTTRYAVFKYADGTLTERWPAGRQTIVSQIDDILTETVNGAQIATISLTMQIDDNVEPNSYICIGTTQLAQMLAGTRTYTLTIPANASGKICTSYYAFAYWHGGVKATYVGRTVVG